MDCDFISECFDELNEYARGKCGSRDDADELVQETIVSVLQSVRNGVEIQNIPAYIKTVFNRRYNDMLRKKYKDRIVVYPEIDLFASKQEIPPDEAEYEAVRREVGLLLKQQREVIVRHYMKNQNTAQIAEEMNIPQGTVLSRLHYGKKQIRDGITKMEKYSEASYIPKGLQVGIWGGTGISNEPFSLVSSQLEANILICAYEKPVTVKSIAEAMGVACAYIEPAVDKLVEGELMGKTSGGLVYTRMFMIEHKDKYGNIPLQEECAGRNIDTIWKTFDTETEPFFKTEAFKAMSLKQQTTLIIDSLNSILSDCCNIAMNEFCPQDNANYHPQRPNGGQWLATGTVLEHGEVLGGKYERSGPVQYGWSDEPEICKATVFDTQSYFGNAHWIYGGFKYKFHLRDMAELYYSLIKPQRTPTDTKLLEIIPDLEKYHITTRDTEGKPVLDIPFLNTDEYQSLNKYKRQTVDKLYPQIKDELIEIINTTKHNVPKHVDFYEKFVHNGTLGAFPLAVCYTVVETGKLPFHYKYGTLPLIIVKYAAK